jgi:hypothetical protein
MGVLRLVFDTAALRVCRGAGFQIVRWRDVVRPAWGFKELLRYRNENSETSNIELMVP